MTANALSLGDFEFVSKYNEQNIPAVKGANLLTVTIGKISYGTGKSLRFRLSGNEGKQIGLDKHKRVLIKFNQDKSGVALIASDETLKGVSTTHRMQTGSYYFSFDYDKLWPEMHDFTTNDIKIHADKNAVMFLIPKIELATAPVEAIAPAPAVDEEVKKTAFLLEEYVNSKKKTPSKAADKVSKIVDLWMQTHQRAPTAMEMKVFMLVMSNNGKYSKTAILNVLREDHHDIHAFDLDKHIKSLNSGSMTGKGKNNGKELIMLMPSRKDKRCKMLSLTSKGKELADKIQAAAA